MRRIERLKLEAREACKWRGHKMSRFMSFGRMWLDGYAIARCQNCMMEVVVKPHPRPNEIDIGGEAVALNCEEAK